MRHEVDLLTWFLDGVRTWLRQRGRHILRELVWVDNLTILIGKNDLHLLFLGPIFQHQLLFIVLDHYIPCVHVLLVRTEWYFLQSVTGRMREWL